MDIFNWTSEWTLAPFCRQVHALPKALRCKESLEPDRRAPGSIHRIKVSHWWNPGGNRDDEVIIRRRGLGTWLTLGRHFSGLCFQTAHLQPWAHPAQPSVLIKQHNSCLVTLLISSATVACYQFSENETRPLRTVIWGVQSFRTFGGIWKNCPASSSWGTNGRRLGAVSAGSMCWLAFLSASLPGLLCVYPLR